MRKKRFSKNLNFRQSHFKCHIWRFLLSATVSLFSTVSFQMLASDIWIFIYFFIFFYFLYLFASSLLLFFYPIGSFFDGIFLVHRILSCLGLVFFIIFSICFYSNTLVLYINYPRKPDPLEIGNKKMAVVILIFRTTKLSALHITILF